MNLKLPFMNALDFGVVAGVLVFILKAIQTKVAKIATGEDYSGELINIVPEGIGFVLLVIGVAIVVGFVLGLIVELVASLFTKASNKIKEEEF